MRKETLEGRDMQGKRHVREEAHEEREG